MKIVIVSPAVAQTRSGNEHTALRWARHLRAVGHRVEVSERWTRSPADVLLALHARKSHASIRAFHDRLEGRPLVVALTGTDLYRDIRTSRPAQESLAIATRLVVLQPEGCRELAPALRVKTTVIFQSADTELRHAAPRGSFRLAVLGHLREEKDPFRAVAALARLPGADIEIVHLGKALTRAMRLEAEAWQRREPRYAWLGSRPHGHALRHLSRAHALVVSSKMEGGANVICEAARIGVPVLASRIAGNVGMLGADYPGYYTYGSTAALARLIERAAGDPGCYRALKDAIRARRALFAPATERRALRDLIAGLAA